MFTLVRGTGNVGVETDSHRLIIPREDHLLAVPCGIARGGHPKVSYISPEVARPREEATRGVSGGQLDRGCEISSRKMPVGKHTLKKKECGHLNLFNQTF